MRLFVCVLACLLTAGCATITRGTTDQVLVKSTPSEARVVTSLGATCQTPCTLNVSRKDEFTVTISKEGYLPQQVDVKTQVAGNGAAGFAGNLLFGGVIGMGADVATGATLEHVPNPVVADLAPVAVAPRAPLEPGRGKKRTAPQS